MSRRKKAKAKVKVKAKTSANEQAYLRKKHYCPSCDVKMKKVKVKQIINLTQTNQEDSKKSSKKDIRFSVNALRCPRCKRQMALDHMQRYESYGISAAAQRRLKKKKIFWAIFALVVILAVLAALAVFKLYQAGLIPQSILNLVKSVLPYRVERLIQSVASNGIWETFKAVIAK